MFLAWFEANNEYPEAKNVKYVDFLKTIVYKAYGYRLELIKQGFLMGRIMRVPPTKCEDYYLRLFLISNGTACVDHVVSLTFKEAFMF